MNHVVPFENTRRKLDWKQEEVQRQSRKESRQRRDAKKVGREAKAIGEEE